MTDLTLDKIMNMLRAHNDGVYRLEAREDLGEIVGWLVAQLEAPGKAPDISRLRDLLTLIRCSLERRFQASDYMRDGFDMPVDGRTLASEICQEVMEHNRNVHRWVEKALIETEGQKL